MSMNQNGLDSRYAQFQGGQGAPGTGGFAGGLGGMQGGLQSLPGGGQFPALQGQMQGRPGQLGGLAGVQQQQQQQQRLGVPGAVPGGLQGAAGGRIGVPGQQQFGAAGVNGMQGLRMAAPGAGFQGLQPAGPPGAMGPGLSGFPQQQAAARGVGVQAGGMAGAGLAGLGQRVGPGGAGFPNPPSDNLMSILGKTGGQRQDEGPSFNAADFPSLSAAGSTGSRPSADGASAESFAALLHGQQKGVGVGAAGGAGGAPFGDEDFPALPGAAAAGPRAPDGAAGAAQLQQLQAQMGAAEFAQLQQQRQALLQQQQAAAAAGMKPGGAAGAAGAPKPGAAGAGGPSPDRFGLLGLLGVIRMTDADTTTLALGTDLTTLGLNLNSPEALWKTFASPWADGPGKPEPDFRTPACYLSPPPRLSAAYFSRFQPDTLFYIFYGMPGDEAQVYAADELSNRGWYYHKELKTWLTRAPNTEPSAKSDRFERGSFFLFDPNTWDVVRKDNFTVSFDALERPPGLLKPGGPPGAVAGAGPAPAVPAGPAAAAQAGK